MRFANKELEKKIVTQELLIYQLSINVAELIEAAALNTGIVKEAIFDKWATLKVNVLPNELLKLEKLMLINRATFNNRKNRRNDLVESLYSPERVIPA